ncbi:MAG: hypothetical protein VKK80_01425 [Prochlorothrix sp.]|nr:hypothetical protein [Prochlorothrix sp.]
MDYIYSIDPEQRLITERYQGVVTIHNIKNAIQTLAADPLFCPDYSSLVDLRVCDFKFDLQDLEELLSCHHQVFGITEGKTALVVNNPRDTALSVLFKNYVDGARQIDVFSTCEAAQDWLTS